MWGGVPHAKFMSDPPEALAESGFQNRQALDRAKEECPWPKIFIKFLEEAMGPHVTGGAHALELQDSRPPVSMLAILADTNGYHHLVLAHADTLFIEQCQRSGARGS